MSPCATHIRRVRFNALRAYVGSGPSLSDNERRAVRVVLKLHEK